MKHTMREKMTNNKKGEEWYQCGVCDAQRPRSQVLIQRGLIRCKERCIDEPSRHALAQGYPLRTEESPAPLPELIENE
jgi:hypothetical protein